MMAYIHNYRRIIPFGSSHDPMLISVWSTQDATWSCCVGKEVPTGGSHVTNKLWLWVMGPEDSHSLCRRWAGESMWKPVNRARAKWSVDVCMQLENLFVTIKALIWPLPSFLNVRAPSNLLDKYSLVSDSSKLNAGHDSSFSSQHLPIQSSEITFETSNVATKWLCRPNNW